MGKGQEWQIGNLLGQVIPMQVVCSALFELFNGLSHRFFLFDSEQSHFTEDKTGWEDVIIYPKSNSSLTKSSVFTPESLDELVKNADFTALKPIDSDSLGTDKESEYLTIHMIL